MRSVLAYPRLIGLGMCMGVAYVLYQVGMFEWLDGRLHGFGYPGVFAAGLLFSYGFTTPFAIAAFVAMAHEVNPFIAAPPRGLGRVLVGPRDLRTPARQLLRGRVERLRHASIIDRIHRALHHDTTPEIIRRWSLWAMAGIVIASPLPDELGVALLSGTTTLSERAFGVICLTMNTLGILGILVLARVVQG
jgi:hypothetical protein